NKFDINCGAHIFSPTRQTCDNIDKKYLDFIKSINNPILRHIFFYFVHYYIEGHDYYYNSGPSHRNGACQYLMHWLQEKKIYSRMVGLVQ
ncbi:CYIR protein, partial [Plasmodium cynomolgi strain B]